MIIIIMMMMMIIIIIIIIKVIMIMNILFLSKIVHGIIPARKLQS